jgi:hypothetical protein
MLGRSGNPVNWDNFRKVVVLVLILWAAVSAVLCIIYFFILGGPQPCAGGYIQGAYFGCPVPAVRRRRKTGANDFRSPDHGAAAEPNDFRRVVRDERWTLRDCVIGHWLAHGFCNLSMSHESRERTGLV